jgi:hypothetical protein
MSTGRFIGACWHCKCEMWLPQALYDAAQHGRETITFYCAYGHPQVFCKGESDLDKMRRERDMARQQIAQREDDIKALKDLVAKERNQANAYKASATKARKRAAAGICPCCNRSFASAQMARHIATKHPDFKADEVA